MQTNDVVNQAAMRIKILGEMGLGPIWLPRYIDDVVQDELLPVQLNQVVVDMVEVSALPEVLVLPTVDVVNAVELTSTEPPRQAVQDFEPILEAQIAPNLQLPLKSVNRVSELNWNELEHAVSTCQACGLCQGRQKTVFGVGQRTATWLFVGEGPSYHEDIKGEPFVGAAGQLLDNMLLALGVRRGDRTYIANVVKCRSVDTESKDRPPTADEIAACLPYLQRQITLIQPQVIVALGKTAAIALTGGDAETSVAQLRGQVHRIGAIPMVATYHPAYLLRKPLEKRNAWKDLCLAQSVLDGQW